MGYSVPLSYVRERRNMPFLKRGMEVDVNGKKGVVTSGNNNGNINVRFEGINHSMNCHPKWETTYYDKDGEVIMDYKETH